MEIFFIKKLKFQYSKAPKHEIFGKLLQEKRVLICYFSTFCEKIFRLIGRRGKGEEGEESDLCLLFLLPLVSGKNCLGQEEGKSKIYQRYLSVGRHRVQFFPPIHTHCGWRKKCLDKKRGGKTFLKEKSQHALPKIYITFFIWQAWTPCIFFGISTTTKQQFSRI